GTLLVNKTGSSVKGGFMVYFVAWRSELIVKLADGKRQVVARMQLPFSPPAHEWIPVQLRFAHERLEAKVAGIEVGGRDFPGFALARSDRAMMVGAYYYPPTRGLKGSIRRIELRMGVESISATEDAYVPAATATAKAPCVAIPLRDEMIVGSNVLVPNWFGASCKVARRGVFHERYVVELPEGFELVASGTKGVRRGRVVANEVESLGWHERDGARYQRYRVELSYLRESGGVFGPLFISASPQMKALRHATGRARTGRPRLLLIDEAAPVEAPPVSIALEPREFPELVAPRALHHSLAWMGLPHSMTWPDFTTSYRTLGFNVVPTLALYDRDVSKSARNGFMKQARREGYELLVVDSPYHSMIKHQQARTFTDDGIMQPFVDPSYRGWHYRAELDRIAKRVAEVKPDWVMMDIECFEKGTYACLIGTSERCRDYLAKMRSSEPNTLEDELPGAVTDLGTELIANIRRRFEKELPRGRMPRMGINTSEPRQIYHRLFDFDKLYDEHVDYAQPVLYYMPSREIGRRIREARSYMERGDIIPWLDPGSVEEFPSEQIYDRVLEVFGSGARGLAWFNYSKFEGADFYYLARAMESVIPVEEVIVGSKPMGPVEVVAGRVAASGLVNGPHHLLLLSDYEPSARAHRVGLKLPREVEGAVWDVARRQRLGEVGRSRGRELSFEWRPGVAGAHTALFYVGPAGFDLRSSAVETSLRLAE
ncbi:MAG: hypothetical protein QF570_19435, partial [Myxococcota bacterium]|nr:hypothetical protein [Myxococcota bacterium]